MSQILVKTGLSPYTPIAAETYAAPLLCDDDDEIAAPPNAAKFGGEFGYYYTTVTDEDTGVQSVAPVFLWLMENQPGVFTWEPSILMSDELIEAEIDENAEDYDAILTAYGATRFTFIPDDREAGATAMAMPRLDSIYPIDYNPVVIDAASDLPVADVVNASTAAAAWYAIVRPLVPLQ